MVCCDIEDFIGWKASPIFEIVSKDSDVAGGFPGRSEAMREGYRRFGIIPFLGRQIAASEPSVYLPNVVP